MDKSPKSRSRNQKARNVKTHKVLEYAQDDDDDDDVTCRINEPKHLLLLLQGTKNAKMDQNYLKEARVLS